MQYTKEQEDALDQYFSAIAAHFLKAMEAVENTDAGFREAFEDSSRHVE